MARPEPKISQKWVAKVQVLVAEPMSDETGDTIQNTKAKVSPAHVIQNVGEKQQSQVRVGDIVRTVVPSKRNKDKQVDYGR